VQAVCDHEGNYFDYTTLFAAFFFSVLSVRLEKNISNLILRMVVCGPLNELVFPGNKCIRHIIHNP
jgi:hypothetical protein